MRAYSPTGVPIVSTLERLIGTCNVDRESFERDEDGDLIFDHGCDGTDICWDTAETVTREGQTVFCDADGAEWLESQLVLRRT